MMQRLVLLKGFQGQYFPIYFKKYLRHSLQLPFLALFTSILEVVIARALKYEFLTGQNIAAMHF